MATPMPVTHFQILSKNPDAAAAFYQRAFGWTMATANGMGYRELTTGGLPGGIWPSPPGSPAIAQLFVDVPDVSASVADAVAAGGRAILPPTMLPDGDEMAIVLDPEGLPFGLVRRKASGA